ncbi:MAG: hypothetical protein ACXIU8_12070 [Alkalilacustris sp.]
MILADLRAIAGLRLDGLMEATAAPAAKARLQSAWTCAAARFSAAVSRR